VSRTFQEGKGPDMQTIFAAYQNSLHKMKHLTTVDRAVREENMHALFRRWTYAQQDFSDDAKVMGRWFPAQRELFNILSVVDIDQVEEMADCNLPLFTLRLPIAFNEMVYQAPAAFGQPGQFEIDAHEEAFLALTSRLDSFRTDPTSLGHLYDMPAPQAHALGRMSSRQLHVLAGDPSINLVPLVSDEYFVLTATEQLTARQRTVLASTTRRSRLM
jgi:hypothetical protein